MNSEQVQDFLYAHLRIKDYFAGGFQDRKAADYKEPAGGWYWVTGEAMKFTKWNPGEPNNSDADSDCLMFWGDGSTWNDFSLSAKLSGYVVEFAPPPNAAAKEPATPSQQIGQMLTRSLAAYKSLKSYSARIELVTKAHIETIAAVKAEFTFAPPNRFRLEGRSETAKVLAVSDGQNLVLATTAPGENTKYVIKPLADLEKGLKEAFSLLTTAPRPPSLVSLIVGTLDTKLWTESGLVGECVESETPQQAIRGRFSMKFLGEDPVEGSAAFFFAVDTKRALTSELDFRFKAYPYTTRETHTNIKVNQPVSPEMFSFTPPSGALKVNDLGEGDDNDITFGPGKRK